MNITKIERKLRMNTCFLLLYHQHLLSMLILFILSNFLQTGQKFAMLELKVLLSSLLRRYRIESLQKFEEISRVAELVMRPGTGIKIRISRRVPEIAIVNM